MKVKIVNVWKYGLFGEGFPIIAIGCHIHYMIVSYIVIFGIGILIEWK